MGQDSYRSYIFDLFFLSLGLSLLFGFMLGERPLAVPDEGRYMEIPREMLASWDFITPRLNGVKYFEKPPLFYWLQTIPIKLFGISEWAGRLCPMILGIIG
ncbi:MAG: glycosyltransferase family 39 protein, partial [Alphaproteobacteria bacterium]|nr:glycosyltransferase family 39 protein [Alphaproteobacteria bacterium]